MYRNPFDEKTEKYSKMFDTYFEHREVEKTKLLIKEVESNFGCFDDLSKARLSYSLGTAYADIMHLSQYNEECLKKCIYYYSYSIEVLEKVEIKEENKPYIHPLMMNLYVNYGNALDYIGRISSSIEYYKKALKINEKNKMVLGNLNIAYMKYTIFLYDYGHRDFFNMEAYDGFKQLFNLTFSKEDSINKFAILKFEEYSKSFSKEYVNYLHTREYNIEIKKYEKHEQVYRQWASKNNLFLNPLNDLYKDLRVSYDIIHLPNMTAGLEEKPIYHGMYNQFKEEYIYLRFLFFEATENDRIVHYADKDNLLLELDDLPLYSIRIEKMKTVFRQLYSMFDKIAYFINSYYRLGIPERKVNFKSIWKEEKIKRKLDIGENFMLNALYWMSKEIYSCDNFSTNPLAEEIDIIRNHLEHKYVKIYSEGYGVNPNGEDDPLVRYISEEKLEKMTLYLMKLVKEIIIYLSLLVNIEENQKEKRENIIEKRENIIEKRFDICRDEWKM